MIKEIPQSSWVDFLQRFAQDHEGEVVKLYARNNTGGRRLIGDNPLIAFEGDCVGEIVNGVKIVIGQSGDNPNNLFHFIQRPKKIEVVENEDGTVGQVLFESSDNITTTLVTPYGKLD